MANADSKPETIIYKIEQPERYSRVSYRPVKDKPPIPTIHLSGKWLSEAGFIIGYPLKMRIMPGCIVITQQDMKELWHCLEGLSLAPFDADAAAQWLKQFPGELNMENVG